MKHVYYVIYEMWKEGKCLGKGCCEIWTNKEPKSMKDIQNMEQSVRDDHGFPQEFEVLILSWTFLRNDI